MFFSAMNNVVILSNLLNLELNLELNLQEPGTEPGTVWHLIKSRTNCSASFESIQLKCSAVLFKAEGFSLARV